MDAEIRDEAHFERAVAEASAYFARLAQAGLEDDGELDELCEMIAAYENQHYRLSTTLG